MFFLVDKRPEFIINYEVADTIWIPLSYFANLGNRDSMELTLDGKFYRFACYPYHSEKIVWGLTLKMIDELLNLLGIETPNDLVD